MALKKFVMLALAGLAMAQMDAGMGGDSSSAPVAPAAPAATEPAQNGDATAVSADTMMPTTTDDAGMAATGDSTTMATSTVTGTGSMNTTSGSDAIPVAAGSISGISVILVASTFIGAIVLQ